MKSVAANRGRGGEVDGAFPQERSGNDGRSAERVWPVEAFDKRNVHLPLNNTRHGDGLSTAATAGMDKLEFICCVLLTVLQRILPLAGLTAGLALVPTTFVHADEPPSDPITQIVVTSAPSIIYEPISLCSSASESPSTTPLQNLLHARSPRPLLHLPPG